VYIQMHYSRIQDKQIAIGPPGSLTPERLWRRSLDPAEGLLRRVLLSVAAADADGCGGTLAVELRRCGRRLRGYAARA
jgi:hypothetical protein